MSTFMFTANCTITHNATDIQHDLQAFYANRAKFQNLNNVLIREAAETWL